MTLLTVYKDLLYMSQDCIHIQLDLKDGKRALSFGENDKKYQKAADVKESKEYKLAINTCNSLYIFEIVLFR